MFLGHFQIKGERAAEFVLGGFVCLILCLYRGHPDQVLVIPVQPRPRPRLWVQNEQQNQGISL